MKHYAKTPADVAAMEGKEIPKPANQPQDYTGLMVKKPWGYEFQIFDNGLCSIWFACLKPGQAVSMHCHLTKKAMFVPLSPGVTFRTLQGAEPLNDTTSVDYGVIHSQENNTDRDVYFLEYEWPSNKADLVRHSDRYGREAKGYEGTGEMVPIDTTIHETFLNLARRADAEGILDRAVRCPRCGDIQKLRQGQRRCLCQVRGEVPDQGRAVLVG